MEKRIFTLPEIAKVGLFDFKLKFGSLVQSSAREVDDFEIELPLCSGGVSIIGDNEYRIEQNGIICAKPGQHRATRPPFRCLYLHITPSDCEVCKTLSSLPDIIYIDSYAPVRHLLEDILKDSNDTSGNNSFSICGKLLIFIDTLKKAAQKSLLSAKEEKTPNALAIESAVRYINESFTHKLTLKMVAEHVYLSPIYFRNLFLETVGRTPYDYIKDKRIELAKTLLATADVSLVDIAMSCGFADQAYFGKVFKAETGLTPREYKIKINNLYP